jgi:hypothetical protein
LSIAQATHQTSNETAKELAEVCHGKYDKQTKDEIGERLVNGEIKTKTRDGEIEREKIDLHNMRRELPTLLPECGVPLKVGQKERGVCDRGQGRRKRRRRAYRDRNTTEEGS